MTILYLTSSLSPMDGWGCYSRNLLASLSAQGVQAIVLSTHNDRWQTPKEPNIYRILSSTSNGYLKPIRMLHDLLKVQYIVKQGNFDLVHCLTEDLIPIGAFVAGKKPFIIHAIGTYAIQPLTIPIIRLLYIYAYRRAKRVICVSRFTHQLLQNYLALKHTNILSLGVDFDRFHNFKISHDKLNIRPLILTVGAIKYRKGIHVSMKGMAMVLKRRPDLRYEIIGPIIDQSLYKELQEFVKKNGLERQVRFLGTVNDEVLLQKYHDCSIFLLTPITHGYYFEGFGLVYLEANACGKPVIASRDCGAEEPVIHGYNGLLVPQDNPEATAEAVEYLLQNPEVAQTMGQNGVARARELDWSNVARDILEQYTAVKDA